MLDSYNHFLSVANIFINLFSHFWLDPAKYRHLKSLSEFYQLEVLTQLHIAYMAQMI